MHKKIHRRSLKAKVFWLFFIVFAIFFIIDLQIRPLVKSAASNRAEVAAALLINEAILEELNKNNDEYSKIIFVDKDQNGKIISVNTDMAKVNFLKSAVTAKVQQKMKSTKKNDFGIPLGTLTGTALLNGRGPKIPLKVNLKDSIETNFRSNFESAAINQTKHQLFLDISAKICAFVPGYPVNTEVNSSVLIAETVLLGDVPSFFAEHS